MTIEKTTLTEEQAAQNGHSQEWLEASDAEQLRSFILQADDRPEELVEIPLWHVKVLVKAMSGSQRALYEANPRDQKTGRFTNLRKVYFEVVRMCCCHPTSKKPIFKVADEGTMMDEKNGAIIDMLAARALRLSGLVGSQQEAVRKNSGSTPTSSTTTDSPNVSASNE